MPEVGWYICCQDIVCYVAELLALCHSADMVSSAAHLEAVMAAIYRGIQQLERQVQHLERTRPEFRKVTGQQLHRHAQLEAACLFRVPELRMTGYGWLSRIGGD